jgi:hypothetical protein
MSGRKTNDKRPETSDYFVLTFPLFVISAKAGIQIIYHPRLFRPVIQYNIKNIQPPHTLDSCNQCHKNFKKYKIFYRLRATMTKHSYCPVPPFGEKWITPVKTRT